MSRDNADDEYIHHFCKLSEAKYVVLVIREIEYGHNNNHGIYSFKELEPARQCYEDNQVGSNFPEILQSRLVEINEI